MSESIRASYYRLLNQCRTENDVNRLHIGLANRLTPEELQEICGTMPSLLRGPHAWIAEKRNRYFPRVPVSMGLEWRARMMDWLSRSGNGTPEPYSRRRIGPNVNLFSNAGDTRSKSLVVCFTDVVGRLLLPIPVFLQHLPAIQYDLLLLTDPTGRGYLEGLPGVDGGLAGLAVAIDSIVDRAAYKFTVSFGASAGGLPALALAAQMHLDKGVSVGGAGRNSQAERSKTLYRSLDESADSTGRLNLLVIYSADRRQDREAGLSMAGLPGISTLGVTSKRGSIGHNPLHPLLWERKLASFLERALDPRAIGFPDGKGGHRDTYVTRTSWQPAHFRP
jgi:hypothetical protein